MDSWLYCFYYKRYYRKIKISFFRIFCLKCWPATSPLSTGLAGHPFAVLNIFCFILDRLYKIWHSTRTVLQFDFFCYFLDIYRHDGYAQHLCIYAVQLYFELGSRDLEHFIIQPSLQLYRHLAALTPFATLSSSSRAKSNSACPEQGNIQTYPILLILKFGFNQLRIFL